MESKKIDTSNINIMFFNNFPLLLIFYISICNYQTKELRENFKDKSRC